MNAYFDALRRYFDFKGRSTRSQFWIFTLALLVLMLVGFLIDDAMGTARFDSEEIGFVGTLVFLAHLIPIMSVTVRRLHDTDRSGWWVLIGLVPLIGTIVLLVFACMPSTPASNRFGPHPKDQAGNASGASQIAVTQPSPTPAAAPLEQLEKLASLRAAGAIDDAEFQRMKADVLDRPAAR